MIRQIQYIEPNIRLSQISDRQISGPNDVKVRIAYSGVCGSDIHLLKGHLRDDPRVRVLGKAGLDIGHEASGTIEELGEAAMESGLNVGDKVALYFNRYCEQCHFCRSGKQNFCTNVRMTDNFMSDIVVVDVQMVYKLNHDFDMRRAALAEPISVCLHGIDLCGIQPGSSVAICGGGGIGNIMMQLTKLAGATRVALFEPVAAKRKLASLCGADAVLNPLDADFYDRIDVLTDRLGFDCAIECSGSAAGIESCCRAVGRGGLVELMATYAPDTTLGMIRTADAFVKELRLVSGVYQSPYTLIRAIRIAEQLNIAFMDNAVFEPEQAEEAFQAQMNGDVVKAMFRFSGA